MATYDIYFSILPEAEQIAAAGRVFSFGYTSAVGVRGPQKLVNRWLKCLFTRRGTDPLDTAYGTGFTDLIGSNLSRRKDFTDAAAMAVSDCNSQITAMDQALFPPDNERLQSASITSLVPRGADGYDVYVTIKNVAGELLTMLLPSGSTRA
jgi:hypothetical protein